MGARCIAAKSPLSQNRQCFDLLGHARIDHGFAVQSWVEQLLTVLAVSGRLSHRIAQRPAKRHAGAGQASFRRAIAARSKMMARIRGACADVRRSRTSEWMLDNFAEASTLTASSNLSS